MGKRLDIGGRAFRKRRGEWVEIPEEWIGKVPNPQTIRDRPSKRSRKARNMTIRHRDSEGMYQTNEYMRTKRGERLFGDEYEDFEE